MKSGGAEGKPSAPPVIFGVSMGNVIRGFKSK
jgi:hypothetical protein